MIPECILVVLARQFHLVRPPAAVAGVRVPVVVRWCTSFLYLVAAPDAKQKRRVRGCVRVGPGLRGPALVGHAPENVAPLGACNGDRGAFAPAPAVRQTQKGSVA